MLTLTRTLDDKGYGHQPDPEIWVKIPSLAGKWVHITVTTFKKRTGLQNRYYWGCIVPVFLECYKQLGYDLTKDETHEVLTKRILGEIDMVNPDTGEITGRKTISTTTLSTQEFIDYCEKCKRYAAEIFNVYIPDAGEQGELGV